MKARARALALPFLTVLAFAGGVAFAASGPATTISTPTAGQKVSLRHTPYLAVAGTASLATPAAADSKFYLRRDGCGTSSDNPHMSTTAGTDAGDGCGLVLSIVGAGSEADQGAFVDYPTTDGMPLTLDASRAIAGVVDLENFAVDTNGAAAGAVTVEVTLEGLDHGNGVALGTDSETVVVTPGQTDYPVAFSVAPNGAENQADLSGIDMRVRVYGPYAFSGFIGNSGKSWVDVPSWTSSFAQSVLVSLDDPSFANAVAARLSGTSWSVAVPTPAVGKHVLYARAAQGFDTGAATQQAFTVTK